MKIFEMQTEMQSYSYPICKIIISIGIIMMCFFRNEILEISGKNIDIITTILAFVFTMLSILCVYISIGELCYVYKNKLPEKVVSEEDVKAVAVDDVINLVNSSNIIEIELYSNRRVVKIGASANCKNSNSVFYDKLFYIEKENYETVELFQEALMVYVQNGVVYVLTIDGTTPL